MQNGIDEINKFLTDTVTAAEMNADDDGLPFETIDAFSTDPIGFGELSERMLARVELIFDQTVLYNRHSAKYLKACAMLERGIKYLGSACLTKIALEKKKLSFPELKQLSTEKLYRMASFNFRKLDTALTENVEGKHELCDGLLDMQFRYYNLLQRLRSTEVKIYEYHDKLYYGKEDWSPVIHGSAFSEKSGVRQYTKEHMDPPAFRNAPAFPLLSDAKEQDSGQQSAVSGQQVKSGPAADVRNQESDERIAAGGKETVDSGVEGKLPGVENNGSAAGAEAGHSEVRVPDSEADETPNTEPAAENTIEIKQAGTETTEPEIPDEKNSHNNIPDSEPERISRKEISGSETESALSNEERPGSRKQNSEHEKEIIEPEENSALSIPDPECEEDPESVEVSLSYAEMADLLSDPEFCRQEPEAAAVFYNILYELYQKMEQGTSDSG